MKDFKRIYNLYYFLITTFGSYVITTFVTSFLVDDNHAALFAKVFLLHFPVILLHLFIFRFKGHNKGSYLWIYIMLGIYFFFGSFIAFSMAASTFNYFITFAITQVCCIIGTHLIFYLPVLMTDRSNFESSVSLGRIGRLELKRIHRHQFTLSEIYYLMGPVKATPEKIFKLIIFDLLARDILKLVIFKRKEVIEIKTKHFIKGSKYQECPNKRQFQEILNTFATRKSILDQSLISSLFSHKGGFEYFKETITYDLRKFDQKKNESRARSRTSKSQIDRLQDLIHPLIININYLFNNKHKLSKSDCYRLLFNLGPAIILSDEISDNELLGAFLKNQRRTDKSKTSHSLEIVLEDCVDFWKLLSNDLNFKMEDFKEIFAIPSYLFTESYISGGRNEGGSFRTRGIIR